MPRPRKQLVSVADTPYYHITSRCVRRAFLCGEDKLTGRSYEHRRDWIETRIRILSTLFAIDLCAYAIMSNHYHLVIKLSPDDARQWTDDEVLERWCRLHKGSSLVQQYREGTDLGSVEMITVRDTITVYRKRLVDLSWFMKCLNEPIARRANAEDDCTGHFWEARFASQALRTDAALLSCMVYVDLNPIRAGIAKTPELSDYTSISERLRPSVSLEAANQEMLERTEPNSFNPSIKPLKSFADVGQTVGATTLPMSLSDYLVLVDTTGRIVRGDKRAAIVQTLTPILDRLHLEQDKWVHATTHFEQMYRMRQRIA